MNELVMSARATVGKVKKLQPQKAGRPDDFQTPADQALPPLLPHLRPGWTIWEPACGKGNLVRGLQAAGYECFGSDVKDGVDFLKHEPTQPWDFSATNPPYSKKADWVARCYELGKPWALLVPLTIWDSARLQLLFDTHGMEAIMIPYRINFETPSGRSKSGSWFRTMWATWGLGIGRQVTYWRPDAGQAALTL